MYSLSLPINTSALNDSNRNDYLDQITRAGVNRVFLTTGLEGNFDIFPENIKFFKERGFEVAIWVGNTIGHGSTLLNSMDTGEAPKYQRLVNLKGEELYSTNCPLDVNFQRFASERIAALAQLDVDLVMLDDDYRLSQHGGSPCCVCPLHMERIRKECGEDIGAEELLNLAFSGKRNKYRDAWMKVQGESLEELARAIRNEVDKVAPKTRIAICSAYCSWDLDGTDPIRLTDILAGDNKKFLRLHGAPYWAPHSNKPLVAIPEIARMFASFCRDTDIEIVSEGDVYPRPRFNTPASYLEIFDAALRADGVYDGILKYMIDYSPYPMHETGYIDLHCRDLKRLSAIEEQFSMGANCGVNVLIKPHLLDDTDFNMTSLHEQSPYPSAGIMLQMCGIPTVYNAEGICSALFGENARHFTSEQYGNAVILDAVSAMILQEKGIDVGIEGFDGWRVDKIGSISDVKSGMGGTAMRASLPMLYGKFKKDVKEVLSASVGGVRKALAYKYENAAGQRFLVFTFVADELRKYPEFMRSYEIHSALVREIEWLTGKGLPAIVERAPELYMLCERGEDHLSCLLCNCFFDKVLTPTVTLDREYSHVDFSGACGRIEGNKVIFDSDIHAFDFVSFKAYN